MQSWVAGTVLLSAIVGTGVSAKLLGLARRTGGWPEWSVGIGLFAYAAVAQLLRVVTMALPEDAARPVLVGLMVLRMAAFAATLTGLGVFTWRVFGVESAWRRWLALGIAGAGAVSALFIVEGYAAKLAGGPEIDVVWRVSMGVAFLVVFGWTAAEALHYHRLMRRRIAIGLADPVVANRFLLWGVAAGLSVALTIVPVAASLAGRVNDPVSSIATAVAGLLNAGVWWLTFTPPAAYVGWIRGRRADGPASA
jgi:hypothetical protein